jgi:eukaryotic-like serine/threonine-protein kinase
LEVQAVPPQKSKWRIFFLALAVISVCAWGGLIWLMQPSSQQPQIASAIKALPATGTVEAITPAPTVVPSPTSIPVIGSTMIGEDGAVLVYVPEGEFIMGSDVDINEQPIHLVKLNAFWIDQNEVTNELFAAFIQATGYNTDAEIMGWAYTWDGYNWIQTTGANWRQPNGAGSNITGRGKYPVVQISWYDAVAYCQWAERRLPTEAEWEKAARGTDQRAYPWGNEEPNETLLNFLGNVGDMTEVGSYPNGVSPYGAYDMSGNAWEWVHDWFQESYYAALENHVFNPLGPEYGDGRGMRGGSWMNFYDFIRTSERRWSNPLFTFSHYGFRCVRPHP